MIKRRAERRKIIVDRETVGKSEKPGCERTK